MKRQTTHLTSTVVCLISCKRVILRCESVLALAVGLNGKNAASETADDWMVRWNGIGWLMQNVREAGTKSVVRRLGLIADLDCTVH